MSQELVLTTVIMVFTVAGVFVGYWSGIARAETQAAIRIEHLLDELDEACELIDEMLETTTKARHPSALRIVKDGA